MKQYNNGQRPTKMYGGGMAMPRKPMGGLAEQNRVQPTTMAKNMGATEPKRFSMGMNLGGAIKKFENKSNGGKLVGGQKKLDKNKDGKISGADFAMMRK
tara:strand:- start:5342 stop:5638 length:297 start_codon:yes stop_codon:yes gene_type:complete